MNKILIASILCFFTLFSYSDLVLAQRTKVYNNTKIGRANNVYVGDSKNTDDKALLVDKYIKKDKRVTVKIGIWHTFPYEMLKRGFIPGIGGFGIEKIMSLKLVGKTLQVNCEVRSIDQKIIALVKNNKLLVSKGLYQHSEENFIEVVDDYNIPVLQVILQKNNSIQVNGVFFLENNCVVLNKNRMNILNINKPLFLLDESEQKRIIYEIQKLGQEIEHLD